MRHIISVLHVLALLGGVCVAVMLTLWFSGCGQVTAPRTEPMVFSWPRAGQTEFTPEEIRWEIWDKNPERKGNRAPLESYRGKTMSISPMKVVEVRLAGGAKPPHEQRRLLWANDANGGLFLLWAMVDAADLGRLEGIGPGDVVRVKGVLEDHTDPPLGITLSNPEFTLIRKAGG